jgi:hypothetical protein
MSYEGSNVAKSCAFRDFVATLRSFKFQRTREVFCVSEVLLVFYDFAKFHLVAMTSDGDLMAQTWHSLTT